MFNKNHGFNFEFISDWNKSIDYVNCVLLDPIDKELNFSKLTDDKLYLI